MGPAVRFGALAGSLVLVVAAVGTGGALAPADTSLLASGVVVAQTPPQAPRPAIASLKIRILSTMLADKGIGEWGFAALVEADGRRLLFDTGARPDTVATNIHELGTDVADVDTVVLTHNHWDHRAGLVPLRSDLMKRRTGALATTYVGRGMFFPRLNADGTRDDGMARIREDYERAGGRFIEIAKPTEIFPGAWLTGPVPRVHPERNWSGFGKVQVDGTFVEDTIPEDMALVLETTRGLVLVYGCGHAGVINTLEHVRASISPAPIHAVIGGLHLFANDDAGLSWTAAKLQAFGVQQLMGAHCTGLEAVYRIRQEAKLDRKTCIVGAVGGSFDLTTGFDPLLIAR